MLFLLRNNPWLPQALRSPVSYVLLQHWLTFCVAASAAQSAESRGKGWPVELWGASGTLRGSDGRGSQPNAGFGAHAPALQHRQHQITHHFLTLGKAPGKL